MPRRLLDWLLVWLALVAPAGAQSNGSLLGLNVGVPPLASSSAYTGPIDIVASPTAFYALRAGSGAIATAGTQKLVNIRRASDNVTCDFLVASSGGFGVTTATCNSSTQGGVNFGTFVGVDAMATCTVATTTATCTSASSTPNVKDLVTGIGLTNPCIVTAVGTFTGGSGTATISQVGLSTSCGTVSVGETLTFQVGGFVTEAYDQSGNGNNLSQATTSKQPQLLPSCLNGLPCMFFLRSATQFLSTSTSITGSQPNISFSTVVQRLPPLASFMNVFGVGSQVEMYGASAGNELLMYAGTGAGIVVTDSAFHSLQGVYNGASSVFNLDGTDNTLSVGTNGYSGQTLYLGNDATGGPWGPWGGDITEFGLWPDQFSSGNRTAICHNQFSFWGTAASC